MGVDRILGTTGGRGGAEEGDLVVLPAASLRPAAARKGRRHVAFLGLRPRLVYVGPLALGSVVDLLRARRRGDWQSRPAHDDETVMNGAPGGTYYRIHSAIARILCDTFFIARHV